MEYEFDDLEIEIGGVLVGCFAGRAYLQSTNGRAYVAHIELDGRRFEPVNRQYLYTSSRRPVSARTSLSPTSELFVLIAAQIEGNAGIQQQYADEAAEARFERGAA